MNQGADSGMGFCFDHFRSLEQARSSLAVIAVCLGVVEGPVPRYNKSGVTRGFFEVLFVYIL